MGGLMDKVVKPSWWHELTENPYARSQGMTQGDVIMDWLSRREVPQENGKYVFYHGTPKKGGATDQLRAGSLLTEDIERAKHFAGRDRDLQGKDINVVKILANPEDISPGMFASLRNDYKFKPEDILKGLMAPAAVGASLYSPEAAQAMQQRNMAEQQALEPATNPFEYLVPSKWGGGLMSMGIDAAMNYFGGK